MGPAHAQETRMSEARCVFKTHAGTVCNLLKASITHWPDWARYRGGGTLKSHRFAPPKTGASEFLAPCPRVECGRLSGHLGGHISVHGRRLLEERDG